MSNLINHVQLLECAARTGALLENHARTRWGEKFFNQARSHFPGKIDVLRTAFRPWALYRWRFCQEVLGCPGKGAVKVVEDFLNDAECGIDACVASFARNASQAPFRFLLTSGATSSAHPLFLDALAESDWEVAWPDEWPHPKPHLVIFGQLVKMHGIGVFTHRPVWMDLCNASDTTLLAFFRLVAMTAAAWGKNALVAEHREERTILENGLFQRAAAHAVPSMPRCADASGKGSLLRLCIAWPAKIPFPQACEHGLHAKIRHDGSRLWLDARGLEQAFLAFRKLFFIAPSLRLVELSHLE